MRVKDLAYRHTIFDIRPEYRYCVEDVCRGATTATVSEWLFFYREPAQWLDHHDASPRMLTCSMLDSERYNRLDVYFKTRASARAFVKEWSQYCLSYRNFFKEGCRYYRNRRIVYVFDCQNARTFFPFVIADIGNPVTMQQIFNLTAGDHPDHFTDVHGVTIKDGRISLFFRNEADAVLAKLMYG